MPDYRIDLESVLIANGCQRLNHIGEGIYRWHSPKTNIIFSVQSFYPTLKGVDEVLKRAGIAPVIKPKRD